MNDDIDAKASVIIVGAGISGLALAFRLQKHGEDVLLIERSDRIGGSIRSESPESRLVEAGPNSTLETSPLLTNLISEAGLDEEKLYADQSSNKRFILRGGRLRPIPMSPAAFFTTDLFTLRAKLRLLREPFVAPSGAEDEETVADFVRRRLGAEFLDYAINPFVAGVYAGDPEELSVKSAFPKLHALEQRYGGLIKGQIRGAKERRQSGETAKQSARMFSFRSGMETLPKAIGKALGRIETGVSVVRIEHIRDGEGGFRIEGASSQGPRRFECGTLVLAMAAHDAAPLIEPMSREAALALSRIEYPPVAVLVSEFKPVPSMHPLDGFGFLIPKVEKRKILGTLFTSTLFGGRSAQDRVMLTSFVGGARQPELALLPEDRLAELVLEEQHDLLGAPEEPEFLSIAKWERAIPQYTIGHAGRMLALERAEKEFPGLFFCANYRGGISVGDCVVSAERIFERIRDHLA